MSILGGKQQFAKISIYLFSFKIADLKVTVIDVIYRFVDILYTTYLLILKKVNKIRN